MFLFLVILIVSFLGCMIQGITGFGFSILAMAVLPFLMPFKTAVLTVTPLMLFMTIQLAFRLRKHIRIKMLVIPLITSIMGRTMGVYMLVRVNPSLLKIGLGIILVFVSIWLIYLNSRVKIKANAATGASAGLISGILGGLCNIGGPPLAIYYYAALEDKNEYNATIQTTFALGGIYNIILHIFYGNITLEVLKLSAAGMIGVILGISGALHIFNKINRELLGKAIHAFILVMGFVMLFSGLNNFS